MTSITDGGVQFTDGTREDAIDVIVCATGYRFRLVACHWCKLRTSPSGWSAGFDCDHASIRFTFLLA